MQSKIAIACVVAALWAAAGYAQAPASSPSSATTPASSPSAGDSADGSSGHERLGVERDMGWEFEVSLASDLSIAPVGDSLESCLAFGVRLDFQRTWFAGLSLPVVVGESAWGGGAAAAFGDADFYAGAVIGLEPFKGSVELSYTMPSGTWAGAALAASGIRSGAGWHRLGIAASISRVLDPLVVSLGARYSLGLPRTEGGAKVWQPGNLSLALGLTEFLNDRLAFSLGASFGARLPKSTGGIALEPTAYSAGVSFACILFEGQTRVDAGVGASFPRGEASVVTCVAIRAANDDYLAIIGQSHLTKSIPKET